MPLLSVLMTEDGLARSQISWRLVPTLGLCALVLWGRSADAGAQPSKHPPAEERGEQLFRENCWHCHGKRALGDGPLAGSGPVAAPALAGRVPEAREDWVTLVHRGQGTMPAFAPVMDRSAIRSILTWLDALDAETGEGPDLDQKVAEKAREAAETAKKEGKDGAPEKPERGAASKTASATDGADHPPETTRGPGGAEAPREAPSPPGDRL